jgi:polyisoprenoid-binding protein YceI
MINTSCRWAANGSKILALLSLTILSAAAQQTTLQFYPAQTSVKFTLGDVLHTVHGTFQLDHGSLQFDPTTGKISGEIVVNAKSGDSGSGMRDRKMHKEVLESERYPEISFHPDRVEGSVTSQGKSSVKIHGIFRIHGVDREIDVPAEVEMAPGNWAATVHFAVPYAKWGMKNPSTLFLRVEDSVQIDLVAGGSAVQQEAKTRESGQ